jgi:hypothetical protein
MLQSPAGATIDAMMKATGWQQHSVRGFLAGVVRKRLKLKLGSKKVEGKRVYQVAGGESLVALARLSTAPPESHAARQERSGSARPQGSRRRGRAPAPPSIFLIPLPPLSTEWRKRGSRRET